MRRAHQCPHQILLREREILVTCFQRYIYIPAHTQIPRQNVSVCSGTNEIDFPSVFLSLSHPSFSIPTRLPLSLLCSGYGKGGTQLIRPSLNLFRLSLSRWFHSHRSMFLLVPAETENGKERSGNGGFDNGGCFAEHRVSVWLNLYELIIFLSQIIFNRV